MSWIDRVIGEIIPQNMNKGQETIKYILCRKLEYFGHVMRNERKIEINGERSKKAGKNILAEKCQGQVWMQHNIVYCCCSRSQPSHEEGQPWKEKKPKPALKQKLIQC